MVRRNAGHHTLDLAIYGVVLLTHYQHYITGRGPVFIRAYELQGCTTTTLIGHPPSQPCLLSYASSDEAVEARSRPTA